MVVVTGIRKNDPFYLPLQCTENSHARLHYSAEAKEIFAKWQLSGSIGLTAETFLACTQTIGAISKLAKYLETKHRYEYLFPGKLLFDPTEGHFGWYGQVVWGNFYVSVKQLLLAEKKIRCLSLLQQHALLGAINLVIIN